VERRATGFQSFQDPLLVYTGGLASNPAIDREFVRSIRSGIPLFVNVTNKLAQCQMAMLLQLLMNAVPVRLRTLPPAPSKSWTVPRPIPQLRAIWRCPNPTQTVTGAIPSFSALTFS
jgi:hypothetical protein